MITTIRNWFKPAAVSGGHELIKYGAGQITMSFRLLPQHQDALESALLRHETERDAKVSAASQKFADAMRIAREAYEKAKADATAARDGAVNDAHGGYEAAHRQLLIQYGRAPTPEELAMARTKPGQVLDLRNVAPAGV